jgi:hypothetical protein
MFRKMSDEEEVKRFDDNEEIHNQDNILLHMGSEIKMSEPHQNQIVRCQPEEGKREDTTIIMGGGGLN